MNFRDWVRATHRLIDSLPTGGRIRRVHFTQEEIDHLLRHALAVLADELRAGNEVTLAPLGRLSVVERPARVMVDNRPGQAGQRRSVPVRRGVRFRPSRRLLAYLNAEDGRETDPAQEGPDPDATR
jgi:nucleoid DNA-binding protein